MNNPTTGSRKPPGGPSTIWGIVYQMLWCLLRALKMNFSGVERDGDGTLTRVVLRLEPSTGGDVQELGRVARRVVQLKTRSGGTWSLQDFIVEVLPDLYRSVDLAVADSSYDFVTDAEMGRWPNVYRFFHSLRLQDCGCNCLDLLDSASELKFGRQIRHETSAGKAQGAPFWTADRYTQRSLFERIVESLRDTPAVPQGESIETTRGKLWHLLGRLNFIGGQTFHGIRAEVDSLLLALVDHAEDVEQKRNSMLSWLSEKAKAGDAIVTTQELLSAHQLDVTPLTEWAKLRSTAQRLLNRDIELRQYEPEHDVRSGSAVSFWNAWPVQSPLLAMTGETGDGKSWTLYGLGLVAANDAGIVVLVDATGDSQKDLEQAADKFWQEITGHGGSQPLSRIAAQRKQVLHKHAEQWLTVLVDGVQSAAEAEALAKQPVEDWGVKLAITGPEDVVAVFQRAAGKRATTMSVGPFSPGERDEYLERRLGETWVRVPSDVRHVLSRPLLAKIYCDEVAGPEGWTPTNEYALFDRMWQRLVTGVYAPGPYDAAHLASLAARVLDNVPYPWPAGILHEQNIDAQMHGRLCRAGWLRAAPQHRCEIPHDRLLNYAVARGLVDQYELGRMDESRLTQILRDLLTKPDSHSNRRLGYVPMDVVHLLLELGDKGEAACTRMFASLDDIHYTQREVLYGDLLPTQGKKIIPVLFSRLEAITGEDAFFHQRPLLEGIVKFDASDIRDHTFRLLNGDIPVQHRASVHILARRPDASALDRLWQLHCQMQDQPEHYDKSGREKYFLYDETMAALQSCVVVDPDWLERAIHASRADDKHTHDLAYLLAGLPNGANIWRSCKAELIANVQRDKARAIINNIGRYRDRDELTYLLSFVDASEDFSGPAAVRALVRIDPDLAIENLSRLSPMHLYMARGWYLPHLLETRREQVNKCLLALMKKSDDPWEVAQAYAGFENEMDDQTVEFLLDRFSEDLQHTRDHPPPPNHHPMLRPLERLSSISKLGLLERLRQRRGTPLEQRLAEFTRALGPQRGVMRDGLGREPALKLLAVMGGDGCVSVVNDFLKTADRYGRLQMISFSHRCANEEMIRRLGEIAAQDELWDSHPIEQRKAADALASLGLVRELVEAILRIGFCSQKLDDFVTAARPFDDQAIEPAVRILNSGAPAEVQLAAAVLALGVARRKDFAHRVLDVLEKAAPASDLALACTIALTDIGLPDDRTLNLLKRQLKNGKNPYMAHLALLHLNTDASLSIALEHIRGQYDERMAINLAMRDATRKEAIPLITAKVTQAGRSLIDHALLYPMAYLDDPEIQQIVADQKVRETLREIALAEEGNFWSTASKARAIRAVATFDQATAFLAAQKAFENPDGHDRVLYPFLLIELDAKRALPVLLRQCLREDSTAVRQAIARALSGVDIESALSALLGAANVKEKAMGCLLLSFRPVTPANRSKLQVLVQDAEDEMADAALTALERTRTAERTKELVAAVLATDTVKEWKWALVDALLESADAGDDGSGPPSWWREVADALPPDLWDYAKDELKKRREKEEKELKQQDERRKR